MDDSKRRSGAIPKTDVASIHSVARDQHKTDPLDHRLVEVEKNGVLTRVSSVHGGWVEKRCYVSFQWPPTDAQFLPLWKQAVGFLRDDLLWLLALPYHRFWSHLVFDTPLSECLDECLQRLPRPFEFPLLPHRVSTQSLIVEIARLLLRLLLRMSTYKESQQNHMTPLYFGRLVYDCFVWHTERILDVCAVYEHSNSALLSRLFSTLFTHQPAYRDDLRVFVESLPGLLSRLEMEVASAEESGRTRLTSVVRCVADTGWTLRCLVSCHNEVSSTLQEKGLSPRIAAFYDAVVPRLARPITSLPDRLDMLIDGKRTAIEPVYCQRLFRLARSSLLHVFRLILEHSCICYLTAEKVDDEAALKQRADTFIETILEVVSEQTFLRDYNELYPVLQDLELIGSVCSSIDQERVSYLANIITVSPPSAPRVSSPEVQSSSEGGDDSPPANTMPDAQMQSLISSVRDLLPDLGEHFVEECLRHFDFDSEKVINAVLEDSLPEPLASLDRTAASKTTEISRNVDQLPQDLVSPVLPQRRNIFDGDQYDIFSTESTSAAGHYIRGKAGRRQRVLAELQDRSELRSDGRYQLFGSQECEGSVYEANSSATAGLYEDEYDDTYDDIGALAGVTNEEHCESDSPLILLQRKVMNAALPQTKWSRRSSTDSESEEHQDVDKANSHKRPAGKKQNESNGSRRGNRRAGPPSIQEDPDETGTTHHRSLPSRDVVGASRGRGQNSRVVYNRRMKNVHKSSVRNSGHDRKQRRGMF